MNQKKGGGHLQQSLNNSWHVGSFTLLSYNECFATCAASSLVSVAVAYSCSVMCMHRMILSYVMANDSKTIKAGGNGKVLPTLSFPWYSGANEREGETLRMREREMVAVLIEVRDHNVDLNIIQVTTVSQGHKILMSGSPWKALGVDFMICKYNVLQQ